MRRPGAGALGGGEGMLALVSRAGVPCAPRACPRCARSTPSLSSVRLDRADFAHRRPRHHIHGILALCALALPVLALRVPAMRALAVRARAVRLRAGRVVCFHSVRLDRADFARRRSRHPIPRRPRRHRLSISNVRCCRGRAGGGAAATPAEEEGLLPGGG